MPAAALHGKDENHHGRQNQQHERETVAQEIAKFFAQHFRNLRRKKTQSVGAFAVRACACHHAMNWTRCLAQLFAAILRRESLPQQRAESHDVCQQPGNGRERPTEGVFCGVRNCDPGERSGKRCKIGLRSADDGRGGVSIALQQRRKKLHRDHGYNK